MHTHLRIVSWNCNGGFRNKIQAIEVLNADIYVIQECEDPAQSTQKYRDWCGDYLWIGTSKNKGIGVFPKNGNKVNQLNWKGEFKLPLNFKNHPSTFWKTEDLKLFLPFTINNSITSLGVWTKGSDSEAFGYIGQLWKYLQIHREELSGNKTLILGDFNSNAIWDKEDRWWSHTDVVNELDDVGLNSLYHVQNNEGQGEETKPTFYLQRKLEKPYHIDYVFCSTNLMEKSKLALGDREEWLEFSDHMPLMLELN